MKNSKHDFKPKSSHAIIILASAQNAPLTLGCRYSKIMEGSNKSIVTRDAAKKNCTRRLERSLSDNLPPHHHARPASTNTQKQ